MEAKHILAIFLLIILIGAIATSGIPVRFMNPVIENPIPQAPTIVVLVKKGTIYHHSCASKLMNTYKNCTNIREVGTFIKWEERDPSNDIISKCIMKSGIIRINEEL